MINERHFYTPHYVSVACSQPVASDTPTQKQDNLDLDTPDSFKNKIVPTTDDPQKEGNKISTSSENAPLQLSSSKNPFFEKDPTSQTMAPSQVEALRNKIDSSFNSDGNKSNSAISDSQTPNLDQSQDKNLDLNLTDHMEGNDSSSQSKKLPIASEVSDTANDERYVHRNQSENSNHSISSTQTLSKSNDKIPLQQEELKPLEKEKAEEKPKVCCACCWC